MKSKELKFDKGWKYLVYFDFILPGILFLIAWIAGSPFISKIFHSYEVFIISPIPNFKAFTGIIGLLFHLGIIIYTIIKKNYRDMVICIVITLIIALFFYFDLNYQLIKPLVFY